MKGFGRLLVIASVVVLTYSIPQAAMAQINSTAGIVTLNASLTESLTVNVASGAVVNFTLAANTAANPGTTTSTVNTAWVLKPGRTAVSMWAWVANGAAALSDGAGDNIPASAVTAAASGSGSAGWRVKCLDQLAARAFRVLRYTGCGDRRANRFGGDHRRQ